MISVKRLFGMLLRGFFMLFITVLKTVFAPKAFLVSAFPFAYCVFDSFLFGDGFAVVIALFSGVVLDCYSSVPYHILTFSLTAFLGTTANKKCFRFTPIVAVFGFVLSFIVTGAVTFLLGVL